MDHRNNRWLPHGHPPGGTAMVSLRWEKEKREERRERERERERKRKKRWGEREEWLEGSWSFRFQTS